MRGPDVVAGWGLFNGLLTAGLLAYGERDIAVALYAGSALLVELVALVVWWTMRSHPMWAARSPSPRRTRPAALFAAVVALVGTGIVWDWWMALPAIYPAVLLVAGPDSLRPEQEPGSSS